MTVWDEIVGQPHAVAAFSAAVTNPYAMTHAWLITGPPGSGRSNVARAFAAALQCEYGGCGACHECRTALAGTHADVTLVRTEKVTIAIDEVRSLVSTAQQSPSQGRWRVIVVEDADRMMERTSNVLLKSVEEPPERTVWLLCAPSPHDVAITIRSRCRQVGLRVPSNEAVARLLITRDGVDETVAHTAARAAQGHIGLARRYAFDSQAWQRRAAVLRIGESVRGVGDAILAAARLVESATAEAKAAAEERHATERAELLHTLGGDGERTLSPTIRAQVRQLEEDQKRRSTRLQRDVLDRALLDLASLYRDVLVMQLGARVEAVNVDILETIERLARQSTPEGTLARLDAISEARARIAGNVAPLLAVEAMIIALRPQAS